MAKLIWTVRSVTRISSTTSTSWLQSRWVICDFWAVGDRVEMQATWQAGTDNRRTRHSLNAKQKKKHAADLADAGVLIKVKLFADVETNSIVFGTAVSETDKRQFDGHVRWAVLRDAIWSQAVGQRDQTVHALAGTELRLDVVATSSRFVARR